MVIENLARYLHTYKVLVIKSTVPIGTCEWVEKILCDQYGVSREYFDIVSNPEFLREGTAVYDFMNPDRIVVGCSRDNVLPYMKSIYQSFIDKGTPFLICNTATAETIKYAANTFLAMKICYINEIASLCRKTNSDIKIVAQGMGLDPRIGKHFLNPGPGFGGSCLPKDTQGIINKAHELHVTVPVIEAILESNKIHQKNAFDMVSEALDHNLAGKTIAILGLSFKAETDDIRYSPAIPIIAQLVEKGAIVKAYDPAAMHNMRAIFPNIRYEISCMDAIEDADAIIVLTEWEEFKKIDLRKAALLLKNRIVIDMRNILNNKELRNLDFYVRGVGCSQ